jgi:hypothetical protein
MAQPARLGFYLAPSGSVAAARLSERPSGGRCCNTNTQHILTPFFSQMDPMEYGPLNFRQLLYPTVVLQQLARALSRAVATLASGVRLGYSHFGSCC